MDGEAEALEQTILDQKDSRGVGWGSARACGSPSSMPLEDGQRKECLTG